MVVMSGMTPLQAGVKSGQAAVVKILLEAGADPNDQSSDSPSGIVLTKCAGVAVFFVLALGSFVAWCLRKMD
jgi:ankyrin repeat protein